MDIIRMLLIFLYLPIQTNDFTLCQNPFERSLIYEVWFHLQAPPVSFQVPLQAPQGRGRWPLKWKSPLSPPLNRKSETPSVPIFSAIIIPSYLPLFRVLRIFAERFPVFESDWSRRVWGGATSSWKTVETNLRIENNDKVSVNKNGASRAYTRRARSFSHRW